MSVKNENAAGGESVVLERPAAGVYASLFEKINLNPVSELSALDIWQDAQAMSDATADERLTAGMQVFLECLTKSGSKVEKLDRNLIDHHIAELDHQISRQLDAVMHHEDFQAVESLWRGVKSLVDKTDFRQNVKVELLDMAKEDLRQDFEDSPEIIQSGLYKHTYIDEYDTPGGEPIAALISAYEFDASAQDVALLRNISKVSAAAHMPFIGSAGPKFFLKESMEDVAATGTQAQSLQSYLTRVTQVRLRLQQVTNAADPQAMTQTIAQTVFQGKAVDLTETRDYGSLIAAGLGQEWSGFGRTVFVTPMEQAWQQVLIPAAGSLNAQWQQTVVSEWNSVFGGRYPFNNSSSDVSLPLLAKYLNADSGRIARFLQIRLKGVLHKEGNHWVPDSINSQGLSFNPVFLKAINTLSHISDVAFTEGNARMNFELRPGTADGVMQTDMIIDSQKLTYVNQMPAWKRFTWPADTEAPGANLSWISTQAGTRQYADIPGAWGWIRLLDKAAVKAYPGVGSSYSLSWKAQDGRTLNYTLRTEAGEGPLALLKLRNFRLPETIFSTTEVATSDQVASTNSDAEEVY